MATNDAASRALGDGVVEGGGFATAQVKLPNDFMLGLQSEVDALEGGNDSSRHANFVNIIALTHAVPGIKNLSASAEFSVPSARTATRRPSTRPTSVWRTS